MKSKTKTNKNEKLLRKRSLEALKFQTHWGLKQYYGLTAESPLHHLADVEIEEIDGLNLTDEVLEMKKLVERVNQHFHTVPIADCGDFSCSIVALAIGIIQIRHIEQISLAPFAWKNQTEKKLTIIYFSEQFRNQIVDWAKENGYNVSSYLGKPIIKFGQLWLLIERYTEKPTDNE